jgi:hypothetical protein
MEGRFLSMILAPNREAIERERKAEQRAAREETEAAASAAGDGAGPQGA